MEPREAWLARTFLELFDTLAADSDLRGWSETLVARCTELFEDAEAALSLAEAPGAMALLAATSEDAHRVARCEIEAAEGPGLEAFDGPLALCNIRLDEEATRWPAFVDAAQRAGFPLVHALPLCRHAQCVGVLVILERHGASRSARELEVAQALVEVAAVVLLEGRARHDERARAGQLQTALDSRVVVEQAKGALAALLDVDVDAAFSLLRAYARSRARPLDEVARGVVDRTVPPEQLLAAARPARRRDAPSGHDPRGDLRP